jgi:antitoxin component YwqK of YwqJK toxin-antitoxin module
MNKWFPNGETWLKCNYVHGKLDGLWQYGKLDGLNCRQEQYSMGVKDGPSREFHLGELIKEEIWKDGVLIHKKEL